MRPSLQQRAGYSLILVTGYIAVILLLMGTLLFLAQESLIQEKREAAIVQARYIAEAAMAVALESYGEVRSASAVAFGTGFYWYEVTPVEPATIQIESRGAKYSAPSRLPAVGILSRWRVNNHQGKNAYTLLAWREELVP